MVLQNAKEYQRFLTVQRVREYVVPKILKQAILIIYSNVIGKLKVAHSVRIITRGISLLPQGLFLYSSF